MDTMENTVETVESEVVTEAPAVLDEDNRNELITTDDNGSVALGVMAGMLLAGGVYVAYTKAVKPGVKWVARKVKGMIDKAADEEPKEEPEEDKSEEAPKQEETETEEKSE